MIKTSVIGLGKMGISHCAIVNSTSDVNLTAVCDTSSFILNAFKKYSGINCYTNYKDLFSKEDLDAVIVATPTKFHYEIVMAALDRGLNVFCEKPFSIFPDEGLKMSEAAVKKGVINQVGFHNRFLGTFRELKRLLDSNVIGDVYHFIGEAYGPVVLKEKGSTWRSNRAEGGGCLYDYASHVLNLIQFVMSPVKKASGTLLKNIYSKDVDDAVFSSLTLENGLSGQLSVNWSDETYRKMSTSIAVFGKKGKIICDATEIKIYLNYKNETEKLDKGWTIKYVTELTQPVNYYLRGEEYSSQIEYFFDCVKNKKQDNINSFASALKTDIAIDIIFQDSNKR